MSAAEADAPPSHPRPADRLLIPFRTGPTPGSRTFDLTPGLARLDGVLYGGTGAAASVLAMEAATQRDALWVVTQFIAPAQVGEAIDVAVDELALGGRIAQLQVRAHVGDRMVFTALGATAHPRPGGLTGQYLPMPSVSPPDDSGPLPFGPRSMVDAEVEAGRRLEYRAATFVGEAPPGALALWARLHGIDELTRAGVAYLADMVPPAVARAAGRLGGGFSLDNALRFADLPPADWVLLDLRGELATNGYGHGSLTAWTPDGTLVATGSQTASMVHLFASDDPRWRQEI
ncbi:MAG TPA: thioesterase family protein [Iamia sp.]|nr:thioesterase family protein [Iamia sp.]